MLGWDVCDHDWRIHHAIERVQKAWRYEQRLPLLERFQARKPRVG